MSINVLNVSNYSVEMSSVVPRSRNSSFKKRSVEMRNIPHQSLFSIMLSFSSLTDPKIKAHVQNFLDQSNHHFSDPDVISKSNQKSRANNACQKVTIADPLSRPSRIPTIIRSPVHSPKMFAQTSHDQKQIKWTQMTSNGSANAASCFGSPEPTAKKSGFEAYMMTGDLILNLSRTQQSSGLIASQTKKVGPLLLFNLKLWSPFDDRYRIPV